MSPIEAAVLLIGATCVLVGAFAVSWELALIVFGAMAIASALNPGGGN